MTNLAARMRAFADEMVDPMVCRQPAYGTPGHDHCAACCYGTGLVITCAEEQAIADAADALRAAATLIERGDAMILPDSSPAFESSPTAEDVARAEGWILAIESSAAVWTLLSPEQQRMVRARIAWALPESERPTP